MRIINSDMSVMDVVSTVVTTPKTLTKVAFMDLAYPLLGASLPAGIARYGAVIRQARASTDDMVIAAMERYEHATSFERDDVAAFLDMLVASVDVDLTQTERDSIVNGWPDNGAA